jgi:very-short-patch-repair endonuclease
LRDRRLGGFKFVRQFAIEKYFVDFICRKERLIVELDGGTHGETIEIANDAQRDQALTALGYKIIRVQNMDVFENIDGVLDQLLALLQKRTV